MQTQPQEMGLQPHKEVRNQNLLLELVTIQRVIIWKQHNQLHLQTTSWQREVTWENSQDHNERNFAKYHSSLSKLLFFLIYFLFFPHAYHSSLFPLSPFFFSFFLYWTNFFSIVVVSNLEKTKEIIAYVIMCFVHIIFTLYYMVLHGV